MRIYSTPQGMTQQQVQQAIQYLKNRRDTRGEYRYEKEIEERIKVINKMMFSTSIGHFSVSFGNGAEGPEYAVIFKVLTAGNKNNNIQTQNNLITRGKRIQIT